MFIETLSSAVQLKRKKNQQNASKNKCVFSFLLNTLNDSFNFTIEWFSQQPSNISMDII